MTLSHNERTQIERNLRHFKQSDLDTNLVNVIIQMDIAAQGAPQRRTHHLLGQHLRNNLVYEMTNGQQLAMTVTRFVTNVYELTPQLWTAFTR